MDLFDDSHTHTAWCWWDCDGARWVCASVDPAEPAEIGLHQSAVDAVEPAATVT
jgi:hypothetical protein